MAARCLGCGAIDGLDRHHPSGRHRGIYLDPERVIMLCRSTHVDDGCHQLVHFWHRSAGLERRGRFDPSVDVPPALLIIGRLAGLAGFLAANGRRDDLPPDFLALLGDFAALLERAYRELTGDERKAVP